MTIRSQHEVPHDSGTAGYGDLTSALDAYVSVFENLSAETLDDLEKVMAPNVRFKDPFNDVSGWSNVRAIFDRMYRTLVQAKFDIDDSAISISSRPAALLHWRMRAIVAKSGRKIEIAGMSVVDFDTSGRVISHIDHWDASEQFYERLPVLGTILRAIKKRV